MCSFTWLVGFRYLRVFDKLYKTFCLICVGQLCRIVLTWCFSNLYKVGDWIWGFRGVWVLISGALSIFARAAGAWKYLGANITEPDSFLDFFFPDYTFSSTCDFLSFSWRQSLSRLLFKFEFWPLFKVRWASSNHQPAHRQFDQNHRGQYLSPCSSSGQQWCFSPELPTMIVLTWTPLNSSFVLPMLPNFDSTSPIAYHLTFIFFKYQFF